MPTESADEAMARQLWPKLKAWAHGLGFSQIAVADVQLGTAEGGLQAWLEAGFHGQMGYMAAHGSKRARPAELVPGSLRVISARMDYLPREAPANWAQAQLQRAGQPGQAVVSLYARGRDYHKVLRQRLQRLSDRIAQAVAPLQARVFCDSAPVLEAELAARSGLGWRGSGSPAGAEGSAALPRPLFHAALAGRSDWCWRGVFDRAYCLQADDQCGGGSRAGFRAGRH
jgi:epoxyqueuosine reductase QueG